MMGEASKLGYLINMDSDLRLNKPQLDIDIDRERASHLGVSVTEIGSTLETLLGGRKVTDFKRGTKQYDVILQMKPEYRATPEAIQNIYIRSTGGLVQLANVVKVKKTVAPKELNHYNRVRSATITASLAPGVTLGKALDDLDQIAASKLPPGIKHEYGGQSLEYKSSSSALYIMFILAIIFIYLVLSAQFESFVHPFTILLSVPLAVFGALLTLFIFGQSLNIYSQIGLIMLIGLVTKNSILIVEFANQQREQGVPFMEAVINSSIIRLRPNIDDIICNHIWNIANCNWIWCRCRIKASIRISCSWRNVLFNIFNFINCSCGLYFVGKIYKSFKEKLKVK